jgi:hypothetical protein
MSDCVRWHGHIKANGYGQAHVNRRPVYAHRLAWERANGPIPDGAQVHHRCGNRACVNVAHLELLDSSAAHHAVHVATRTTCKRGRHPWTEDNIYTPPSGNRQCRGCRREARDRLRARSRA